MRRLGFAVALLALCGCAPSRRLAFDPWRGLSQEAAEGLEKAVLPFSRDEAFRAAEETLDHEPFYRWEFEERDPKAGLITARTGRTLLRIRFAEAPGNSGPARTAVEVGILGAPLKGSKEIWVSKKDSLNMTAYDIEFSKRDPWRGEEAAFELGPGYFVSAFYRRLTDRSAVPFALEKAGAP